MREGFYRLNYGSVAGVGFGLIAMDHEAIIGVDAWGGEYDGTYHWNSETKQLDATISVFMPEGVHTVFGSTAPKGGLRFNVACSFPRDADNHPITAITELGSVRFQISFLRTFPD